MSKNEALNHGMKHLVKTLDQTNKHSEQVNKTLGPILEQYNQYSEQFMKFFEESTKYCETFWSSWNNLMEPLMKNNLAVLNSFNVNLKT